MNDQPCTCNKGNVVFCPANCENRIPDREELIDFLKACLLDVDDLRPTALSRKQTRITLLDAIKYIQATPLHLITPIGQRLCDCEKADNVPLYKMPEVNQAKADDWLEGLEVPIANKDQITYLASLIDRASFSKKKDTLKHSPWLGKLNISSLISKLERL